MSDYVLSIRAVHNGAFIPEVGPSQFLVVPDGQPVQPSQASDAATWRKDVRKDAGWHNDKNQQRGDVLFVVHGYNNSEQDAIQLHRKIRHDLEALGFKGVVVSFDWPSYAETLAYVPDRCKAKQSAFQLVSDGIDYFSSEQSPDCTINVHVLAHSMGAFVVREAFDDADDRNLKNGGWMASQIFFVAGDVSAASMARDNPTAESVYRHCIRLTNYSNRHDQVLELSGVKRLGLAPRVGRVGLPSDAPAQAVNVDCSDYYDAKVAARDVSPHSWFFGSQAFVQDLFGALKGFDREVIATRTRLAENRFQLKQPDQAVAG